MTIERENIDEDYVVYATFRGRYRLYIKSHDKMVNLHFKDEDSAVRHYLKMRHVSRKISRIVNRYKCNITLDETINEWGL